jgi:inner membrane protein
MFARTHIAIVIFFSFLLFQESLNFLLFLSVSVIATLIPDLDSKNSKLGKKKVFRIFNLFTKHRGIVHSFIFLFALSVVILLFWKEVLLPFILGYGLHLIADSFTIQGTRIFYPFKIRIKGFIKTGGIIELIFFSFFICADLLLMINKFYSVI